MNTALVSGLIILVLLIIMLIAGVPIAVALGVSSVCAILPIMDLNVAVLTGCQRIFSGISVFSLLAIPFFILAGNIMNKGGIAVRLINFAKLITGRAPGALAQTNILANMLFGSISGSGTAAASAMGSMQLPIPCFFYCYILRIIKGHLQRPQHLPGVQPYLPYCHYCFHRCIMDLDFCWEAQCFS